MVRLVLSLCVLFALTMSGSAGESWRVARVLGMAWIINPDRTSKVAAAGADIEDGQTVSTGGSGRVMLVKGAASMLVGPGTSMAVRPGSADDGRTVVVQRAGTVDFQVEKRDVRYFSVETPYLAAVVKGTHFRVAVAAKGATVKVQQGLVLIDGFRAGQTTMLPAGQMVQARRNGKLIVTGTGRRYQIVSSAVRPALVAAADGTTENTAQTADADSTDATGDDSDNGNGKGKANGKSGNNGNGKGGNGNSGNGNGGGNGKGNNGNGNGNGGGNGSNGKGNGKNK